MLSSYEANTIQGSVEVMEVKGPDIPLMPLVLRIHFVSCATGEGIPNFRKTLYKVLSRCSQQGDPPSTTTLLLPLVQVASGGFTNEISPQLHCTLLLRDIPYLYSKLESMLRQLRVCHREGQEGQQRVLCTLQELREQLKSELKDVEEDDLKAALRFMHQVRVGWVWLGVGCCDVSVCVEGPDLRAQGP